MSGGIHDIADRTVDQLGRKGLTGNKKATKISQVSALIEVEDYARKNDIGVVIYGLKQKEIIFQTRLASTLTESFLKHAGLNEFRVSPAEGGSYYWHTSELPLGAGA